ncbi:MAG: hypothetical protein EBU90_25140, partial [Proteobacteria bacterium]|nr:hypothetical protein [Pseudomonadota bacterium]
TNTNTLAAAAYGAANTAASNNVYLQTINNNQNTSISATDALATSAYAQANNASGNTVALQAVNIVQNTNISAVNTFTQTAFNTANAGVALASSAYNQANNVSGNTVALQSQMTTTNNNISGVNTLATAAYSAANTAAANTVYLQSIVDSQNTSIAATDTLATAAYGKANAEGSINNTQNTWITNTNNFAQSAYDTANLKFNTSGGTITGNVTIQNNLIVQGNLSVLGNSTTISTASLSISDPLIFLANGNIVTDAVDIGLIGHYGGPSGETHTGIFRDPNRKEWILFQEYTTQVQSNNLINIADPTFAYANLYANVVKSNVVATYITVNGLDVNNTMTNAWNSANAGVTLATAAYGKANAEGTINNTQNTWINNVNTYAWMASYTANAAWIGANTANGNVSALQAQMNTTNTNISSVNTFTGHANIITSSYNQANASNTLATAAYQQANAANTLATTALDRATTSEIVFVIDGGGSTISTGLRGSVEIPFNCNVVSWTVLADQSGTLAMNVYNENYNTWGPTLPRTNEINFGVPISITSSASKNNYTLITQSSIAASNLLSYNVQSVSAITRVSVCLKVIKT